MMTNASEYIKDHIFEKVARNQKVVQNEKSCSKYKTCQKVPKQLVESPTRSWQKNLKEMPSNLWKALYILFPSTKQLQKNQSK